MLFIYNILIELVAFVVSIRHYNSLESNPQWIGRFAKIEKKTEIDIWIHAASVGEVKVIGHLIKYLQSENPSIKIHITTMTATGYQTAKELYTSNTLSITQFPFDTKKLIKKTFDLINPKTLVIAETEIWPNLILEASDRKIPIILINGRMSTKAFKRYILFQHSFKMLLSKYSKLFVKSETDYKHYNAFVPQELLCKTGDIKFDAPLVVRTKEKIDGIRLVCGIAPESFIFVAGSTRPGEEEMLAEMFLELIKTHKTFNLIIAPRHLKRVGEIKNMLLNKGIQFKLHGSASKHESVILVDKVGILQNLYLASNVAFVGGTLVDIGGHNLLEPVWAGVPVLFGGSTFNVKESEEYIIKNNYGIQIQNVEDLISQVQQIISKEINFNVKTTHDVEKSATKIIGAYIKELI